MVACSSNGSENIYVAIDKENVNESFYLRGRHGISMDNARMSPIRWTKKWSLLALIIYALIKFKTVLLLLFAPSIVSIRFAFVQLFKPKFTYHLVVQRFIDHASFPSHMRTNFYFFFSPRKKQKKESECGLIICTKLECVEIERKPVVQVLSIQLKISFFFRFVLRLWKWCNQMPIEMSLRLWIKD